MDKIKKIEASGSATENTPGKSEIFSSNLGSPDFPFSSQECFKVGWDWSHDSNPKQPKIRVIEKPPESRKKKSSERAQCLKPRRLVSSVDPNMYDASMFLNDLKLLTSSCNGLSPSVIESGVPGSSAPNRISSNHVPTPTAERHGKMDRRTLKNDQSLKDELHSQDISHDEESRRDVSCLYVGNSTIAESHAKQENELLSELLEDSLCEEIVKCTQELESKLFSSKTPELSERKIESSAKKKKLSLKKSTRKLSTADNEVSSPSSKHHRRKEMSAPDTSRNDKYCLVDQEKSGSFLKVSAKKQISMDGHTNNDIQSRKCIVKSREASEISDACFLDSDDFFVSPEVLDIIDLCEKNATQEPQSNNHLSEKDQSLHNSENESVNVERSSEDVVLNPLLHKQPLLQNKGKLSEIQSFKSERLIKKPVSDSVQSVPQRPICTPEEIEKKRQVALKKRLSLKKRS